MGSDENLPETFPGARFCKAVQASVDAILAPMGIRRRVVSVGVQFCNVDAWTGEMFAQQLCGFFSKHPARLPDRGELGDLLRLTNAHRCPDPHIRVARMPDRVTHRVALAIIGGGYHEAWHTKYSKRDQVTVSEVHSILDLAKVVVDGGGKFDAKMRGLLMTLHHLIEDIRIERRGNEDFPGAYQPMCDLQDFILGLEATGRETGAKIKNVTVTANARSIMLSCFRDLGLGYNTERAREAIEYYRQATPAVLALFAEGGMMTSMLEEAQGLTRNDKMGSLRVAMKIVVALWKSARGSQQDDSQPETCCPKCGASAENLVLRSVKNAAGMKIRGRAEVECKICGFKTEIDLPDTSLDLQQEQESKEREHPEIEDLDQDDVGAGADGWGDDTREHARDRQGQEEEEQNSRDGGESAPKNGSETNGQGSEGMEASEGEDADTEEDGDGERDSGADTEEAGDGEDSGAGDGEGDCGLESLISSQLEATASTAGNASDEQKDEQEDTVVGDKKRPSRRRRGPAGNSINSDEDGTQSLADYLGSGGHVDLGQDPELQMITPEAVLEGSERDGIFDHSSALHHELAEMIEQLRRDLLRGERLWNPFNTSNDEARVVRVLDPVSSLHRANEMIGTVNSEIASLRARFRSIFRAQEMTDVSHGVRRGRKISSRMLVDSKTDLKQGRSPTRAYVTEDAKTDTSVALAACLDQSGSMIGMRAEVAKCLMVMVDPIERVGGATMAFGFRNGAYCSERTHDSALFHRVDGIRYDVFKKWEERFDTVKSRFALTLAEGSTPMSDGVQYGLAALNERDESHRILAIITDGQPDAPHEQVIRRQVRLAKEAGIHVLGIGIGHEALCVKILFPDHVWANSVRELPPLLIAKITTLLDFSGRNRGRRASLDGKAISRKVS